MKAIEYADRLIIISDTFRNPLMRLGAEQEDMATVITGIDYDAKQAGKEKPRYRKIRSSSRVLQD